MRRLALYSDVHANVVALEAVLADIKRAEVGERYCLGDLVGYGPDPVAAIALVRCTGDAVIQGNYDRAAGGRLGDCGSQFASPQETLDGAEAYAYTLASVDRGDARYLNRLEREVRLEIDGVRVVLCHGSPRRVNELIMPDVSSVQLVNLARTAEADVVCAGHAHVAFHRSVPTERGVYHWVNAGSVGRPRDGDSRACWVELVVGAQAEVLLHASVDTACRRVGDSDVWLGALVHRVAYDVDEVARRIKRRGLPVTLAAALKSAEGGRNLPEATGVIESMGEWTGRDDEDVTRVADPEMGRPVLRECGERGSECSCAITDRIVAYECLASFFEDEPRDSAATVRRLRNSMRTCITNPHLDDELIEAAFHEADIALRTVAGHAAFAAERERLIGDCDTFSPFRHVLSATEVTYLAVDPKEHGAQLRSLYRDAAFPLPQAYMGAACPGHISIELRFMAHCLRGGLKGDEHALDCARSFFADHLAEWGVLFAVVVGREAKDPVMRYAGLALDKFLICEAATFRHAVPEVCEMRRVQF